MLVDGEKLALVNKLPRGTLLFKCTGSKAVDYNRYIECDAIITRGVGGVHFLIYIAMH